MYKKRPDILLVEDSLEDQELILRAFEECCSNYSIQIVNNGSEAIAYLMGEGKYSDRQKYPYPCCIITDLKMPQVDGFDVLQHIKANPDWAIIPTVVLSASADKDDIRTAYMLGATSYHVKPLRFKELLKQVKVLHEYWSTCEVPGVDNSGKQLPIDSKGKLGGRFHQEIQHAQKRVDK
jgi:two-component system, response regulator